MTLALLRHPPAQIIAGDSIEFLVAIPGDLTGYVGSARLTGPSQMDHTSCVTEGSDYHVKFEGQTAGGGTQLLLPGQYTLTVWAKSANDRYTVLSQPLTITPDLSIGDPGLAHAVKTLDLIERAIRARLGANSDGGIEEYSIEGTAVRKLSIDQLEKLRNKYSAEVERQQNQGAPIPRVKFVMTPVGTPLNVLRRYG